jgi:hypothetical protein
VNARPFSVFTAIFRLKQERRGSWSPRSASGLNLPKEDHLPNLPFTAPEWEKILWACEVYPDKGIYGFDLGDGSGRLFFSFGTPDSGSGTLQP